jgi:hypothetical protein
MKQSIVQGEQTRIERDDVKSVAMTLDDAALDILMKSLTNLYSNPELAVLREYSSNALDSHIRSGQERPVRIILPTGANPHLVIEDFGLGLSEAEITDIYSRYGASTKRDSNTQIGAFGLGAKSALAMAERFEIVATKNGITSNAYVKKNSYGVGVIYFESVKQTGAPNGVRISVPVSRLNAYHPDNLTNFFLGWEPKRLDITGLGKINSIHDESKFEALTLAGKTIAWTSGKVSLNNPGYLTVNVGGVIYRVGISKLTEHIQDPKVQTMARELVGYGRALVLNVPIGSVEFTPSREDFIYSPATVATLVSLITSTTELMVRRVQQDINALTDLGEVLAARYRAMDERLPRHSELKYRGQDIPTFFDGTGLMQVQASRNARSKARIVTTIQNKVGLQQVGATPFRSAVIPINEKRALLVKHAKPQEMLYVKSHVYKYYLIAKGENDVNPGIETWFTTGESMGDKWADALITETIEFDEYVQIAKDYKADLRPPKEERAKRVKRGDMTMFSLIPAENMAERAIAYRSLRLTPDEIRERGNKTIIITKEDTHTAYLVQRADTAVRDYNERLAYLHHFYPQHDIIIVPPTVSLESLTKRFPDAERADPLLQVKIDAAKKSVKVLPEDVSRQAARKMTNVYTGVGERVATLRNYMQKMQEADWDKIESEETREKLRSIDPQALAQADMAAASSIERLFTATFTNYNTLVEAEAEKQAQQVQTYLNRYRLLRSGSYYSIPIDHQEIEHFLTYVNMVDKMGI